MAFVDFAATAANICGLEIPAIWEGRPFLGPGAKEREFVYLFRGRMDERYDTVRAIRTKKHLYVHNFSPHRPVGQAYTYPFRVLASMGSWYEAFKAGKCNALQARYWKRKQSEELYEIAKDPFQIRNLEMPLYENPALDRFRSGTRRTLLAAWGKKDYKTCVTRS